MSSGREGVWAVGTAAAALLGALSLTTALGSADDLGRAGRQLERQCSALVGEGAGPWPGSFCSLPLGLVVVAGVAVAAVVLPQLVRRPRHAEQGSSDDALRRSASTAVVTAVGLLVSVPLTGVSLLAAWRLLGICAPPPWWTAVGWVLAVVAPLAVAQATPRRPAGGWAALLLAPVPTDLSPAEITAMLRGPGTTIGAFCDSGACLRPFR